MALNHLEDLLILLPREVDQLEGFIKLTVQLRNIWAVCRTRQTVSSL